jgi:adenylate cyclase
VVRRANRQHALSQIDSSLRTGARIFEKLINQRNQQLANAAAILSRDHAFQEAFAGAEEDRATTLSALTSLKDRIKADVILIGSLQRTVLFDTQQPELHGTPFPFPRMIDRAENSDFTYSLVLFDRNLYAMAIAPLLAPDPIAWLCPAFRIDDVFAREIKGYANAEITFVDGASIFGTTLSRKRAAFASRSDMSRPDEIFHVRMAGEDFLSYTVPLPAENGKPAALLQRSLDQELAPYRQLEHTYLGLAILGLAISLGLGAWIAGGVSRPVLELAEGAREIKAGNYQHRVHLDQEDEVGALAASFNEMSLGLAERDRVRDLLGKVVSPEVAAELLRKGVALGGEEREVTILFSDLRDFTGISEVLPPRDMLRLLNDYFTRMSAIVEKHGGVVDKYVGDALMAIFGAPVAKEGDADHALQAALEMSESLDQLNREWGGRGLPAVEVGIGINTDVVVAGNMGSEKRLNYTVIGDGVNLASRLEGLTKISEYATRIIVSARTLGKAEQSYRTRLLGDVAVKGRQKLTQIFALVGTGDGVETGPGGQPADAKIDHPG